MFSIHNGLRNFMAAPPRVPHHLHNLRVGFARGGVSEVMAMQKNRLLPWSSGTGPRAYILHYRRTMLAQKRGEVWRGITSHTMHYGYEGEPGKGWNDEYPIRNTPFATWAKSLFWRPLPRPWRYFQACDCWKYADSEDSDHNDPQATSPCGGNRSNYGCLYG